MNAPTSASQNHDPVAAPLSLVPSSSSTSLFPIAPGQVRYIKLGAGNAWADKALDGGEVHFTEHPVPAELASAQDFDCMRAYLLNEGHAPNKATDITREVRDFFTLGRDCLWITFARGDLWWAFAEPEVRWLGDGEGHGRRMRKVVDGAWSNHDVFGQRLSIQSLSTRLTKVRGYRQTICKVSAQDYLLDRLNCRDNPIVARGERARSELLAVANDAIAHLDWSDFETMADLIFARSGFQRVSSVGGTQADTDLVFEHPATGERSFVQVKSSADQSILEDYIGRFESSGLDRMFFICHSPAGSLNAFNLPHVHVWSGSLLAKRAIDVGLFGWVLDRLK